MSNLPRATRTWGLTLIVMMFLVAACGATAEPTEPEPEPALPDGTVFAMVTVGSDESGETTLGVDVAEMLSGEEARDAAVADGVIEEGEDLPNDFYIDNDETEYELLHLSDDAEIRVISGTDTGQMISIGEEQLIELWEGDYAGEPIYGIVASVPMAMNVTVADGVITEAEAVYLP